MKIGSDISIIRSASSKPDWAIFNIIQRKQQQCFLTVVNFGHEDEITPLASGLYQRSSSDTIFHHRESPPVQPSTPWEKTTHYLEVANSVPANQTKQTSPNTTGSHSLPTPDPGSVYILLVVVVGGGGVWKHLARLCPHWELSDNSHFKLFWYQLCGELPFPWEHDLPRGSGACCTARRINRWRGRESQRQADEREGSTVKINKISKHQICCRFITL